MKIGSSYCLRNTHLQPPHLLVDRPPIDGRPGEARGRAGRVHGRLSPSLVKTVLQALSRRSTCWTWAPFRAGHVGPVSDSLQAGIGFFQHPVPHLRRRSSRSACLRADSCRTGTTLASEEGEKIGPCSDRNDPGRRELNAPRRGGKIGPSHRSGGDTGFPRSAPEVHAGVGACCRPGAASDREGLPFSAPSGHLHLFGPSLSASLACSRMTIGHRRFTSVHRARFLALTRDEAPRRALLSRDFEPRVISTLRHIVRAALDSGP